MLNLYVNDRVVARGRYISELQYNSEKVYPEKLISESYMKYLLYDRTPFKIEYEGDTIHVFDDMDAPISSAAEFKYKTGLVPISRFDHSLLSWQCTLESGKTLYAPTLERLFGLWLKA